MWEAEGLGTEHVDRNLDLVGKLYQKSIYPDVFAVARGDRLATPLVIDLDPTTVCDLGCPECISSNVLHTGALSRDRIVRFAEELAATPVRAVILIGGGEPLLHRAIATVIDTLAGAGIRLGLVTNGTQIGRHLDQLASRLSWVRVSVDAATQQTYDRFRPSRSKTSAFPAVIDNMRRLAAGKQGRLGYSFLLMRRATNGSSVDTNYPEVFAAGQLAKSIGCDYFEIKAMLDEHHFTVNQQAADIALVEEQLDALRELEDETFRVLSSSNWEAVRRSLDPVQPKTYTSCHVAELRTTVTPNGVYICPYHRGNPKAKLGELGDAPFTQLWAGIDTRAINPSTDCAFHCARHPTNLAIEAMAEPAMQPTVAGVDDFDPFI
jgi:MoaA/NifB/PqqE/SkfB family radical SAM enzyme